MMVGPNESDGDGAQADAQESSTESSSEQGDKSDFEKLLDQVAEKTTVAWTELDPHPSLEA